MPPSSSSWLLVRLPTLRSYLHNGMLAHARARPFTSTALQASKQLPPRRAIHDSDIEENFLKGSGPGGQKINKTSSAVQLKHLATGIVIKCQETRSRTQNRKIARRILAERIEELELGDQSRTAVKARLKSKKKASADKKKKRKYRALEAAKDGGEEDEVDEEDNTEAEIPTQETSPEDMKKGG
ncbi:RF-1 domain-domain-containing protein [Clohesyomyces aquaticus]|uniref:RF-1 domain-domain-containing protein n=1 Tax=Clohesyomyces aquaticus TaxID=1231657 RepID=A0A1Y2A7H0_9PLEO|nr:RF-1 domain-domain-containing protein [Clohesyomyces aquaticus]